MEALSALVDGIGYKFNDIKYHDKTIRDYFNILLTLNFWEKNKHLNNNFKKLRNKFQVKVVGIVPEDIDYSLTYVTEKLTRMCPGAIPAAGNPILK